MVTAKAMVPPKQGVRALVCANMTPWVMGQK